MTNRTIFYKKVGRRYVPVSEYDNELLDSFPKGDHLVSVYPGGGSRRFNIDPALAPMIAAGRYAEDAITRKIQEATELRPMNREVDEETQRKWKRFIATIPDDFRYMFTHGSARDAAEAGVKAMMEEAEQLLTNPAVRKAYDRFLFVCQLTKESERSNEQ
jgi:hypothetical protein